MNEESGIGVVEDFAESYGIWLEKEECAPKAIVLLIILNFLT